jgi:inner membrane protein
MFVKGSNHILFGTLLGAGTQIVTGFPMTTFFSYPSYYGGLFLGSLLPDIDHPQSYLGRRTIPLSVLINKCFGHRGFTHSILSLTLLGVASAVWWGSNPLFFGGLLIGYFSHLLGDMTTVSGIPLLYPKKKRYGFVKRRVKR